jgi:hypothetical protein
MGGISKSKFYLNSGGEGAFEGEVSLANNGGFCAVKYVLEPIELIGTTHFLSASKAMELLINFE